MKRRVTLSTTIFLLAAQLCLAPPAQCQDLAKFLGNVAGMTQIDKRQSRLEKRIKDARAAGRLTKNEADNLQKTLNEIADLEAAYRASDNKLSAWETLKLALELDRLSRTLEAQMRDRQVALADIDTQQEEIKRRIAEATRARRLTRQEEADLLYEFNRIADTERRFRGKDGDLSYSERLILSLDLDRLANRLEKEMHDREIATPDLSNLRQEVNELLDSALASEQISHSEALDLRSEFIKIQAEESSWRKSDDQFTAEEALATALQLEKLKNKLELRLNKVTIGFDTLAERQAVLDAQIAQGIETGSISAREGHRLKKRLDSLKSEQDEKHHKSKKLSYKEGLELSIAQEKLASRISNNLQTRQSRWKDFENRLDQIEKRINNGFDSQRLTGSEATELKQSVKKLRNRKAKFKQSGSRLDSSESLKLSFAMEDVSNRLEQLLHDRELSMPDIDERQAQVDARIAEALSDGRLTILEAQDLKVEFDAIAQQEDRFRTYDKGLNYRDSLGLALELERLATRVERKLNNRTRALPGFSARKAEIKELIEEGSDTGALTDRQAARLKSELERISSLESSFRQSEGVLSTEEALVVALDLDRLNKRAAGAATGADVKLPDIDKRQTEVDKRIAEGVATGRLTASEASKLKELFERVTSKEAEYRASGGLSYGEHLTLALELERLAALVERQMNNEQISLPNVDSRQAELDQLIAEGLSSGSLTLKEADQLNQSLNQIARLEAKFRYSGGGLSYVESLRLNSELDALKEVLDRLVSEPSEKWVGIDVRQAELNKKIRDAISAKSISPHIADELNWEANRILQAETSFKRSGGSLTYAEALSLVADLELLKRRIDQEIASSNVAWTNIDARQKNIKRKLDNAIYWGRISHQDSEEFLKDFDRIARLEARYRAQGGLTRERRKSLARQLDNLTNKLDSRLKGQQG